jgi:ribonuclease E
VIAGSPADPSADQPDVDPAFRPHGQWGDLPARRRGETPLETPDHGVTSQGITWEIVGAAREPEEQTEPEVAEPPTAPAAPMIAEPEPLAESPPAREPALANGTMAHAETTPSEASVSAEPAEPEGPPRRGWWQRRFGSA